MSLEQVIAQQTAAIIANTEAMNALLSALANGTAPIGAQPVVEAPKRGRVKAEIRDDRHPDIPFAVEPEVQATPAPSIFNEQPAEETKAPTRTLEDVQKLVLERVQIDRNAVIDTLKSFGAAKASQLKPDQLDAAFDALSKIGA